MGGLSFGKLWYVRNIVYVRLSSFEQNAFANFWTNTWRGFKRDTTNMLPYVAPAFIYAYLVITWGKAENERLKRKNPKDYENDV